MILKPCALRSQLIPGGLLPGPRYDQLGGAALGALASGPRTRVPCPAGFVVPCPITLPSTGLLQSSTGCYGLASAGLIGVLLVSAGSITTFRTVVNGRVRCCGCLRVCDVSGCTVMVLGACALLMDMAMYSPGAFAGPSVRRTLPSSAYGSVWNTALCPVQLT